MLTEKIPLYIGRRHLGDIIPHVSGQFEARLSGGVSLGLFTTLHAAASALQETQKARLAS